MLVHRRVKSTKKDRLVNVAISKASVATGEERSSGENAHDLRQNEQDTLMIKESHKSLELLLKKEQWAAAEKRITQELKKKPDDHWLLTQLGSVLYEQKKYKASLKPLRASLRIVPDCPLTLWHLAGVFDMLGHYEKALAIYSWLLQANVSPQADPCWESNDWANALKTDCMFRIGRLLERRKKWAEATEFFNRYIKLRLAGIHGIYSLEEAAQHIQGMKQHTSRRPTADPRQIFADSIRGAGILRGNRKRSRLSIAELVAS